MSDHIIQPIRVLQVLTILDRGGAETMVMNYYRHIDRTRVQFDFLVHRQERGAYEDEVEALGGRIYRIPPVYSPCAHHRAVCGFLDAHPGYRVIHGHVGELGYFLYKEAARRKVPCIIAHAHNAASDWNVKWPMRWALKHLVRPYVNTPMTCGTEAARWLFGRKMAGKAQMLNNAIHAAQYAYDGEQRQAVRQQMGWEECYVVGDVARFSPPKNHLFLLRLFGELLQRKPEARLVLVGAKEGLYAEVESYVKLHGLAAHVEFLGARDDVPRLLQGMDVYCSPSRYEGLSVSMVEAQAAGLRIITSDKVPAQVRLIPGLVGFLPLTAPPGAWVDALLAPYERRDTYQDICQAGFDIAQNAAWLQQFYLEHTMDPSGNAGL